MLGISFVMCVIRGPIRFATARERRCREKLEAQPETCFARGDRHRIVLIAVVTLDDVPYTFQISDEIGRAARPGRDFPDDFRQQERGAYRLAARQCNCAAQFARKTKSAGLLRAAVEKRSACGAEPLVEALS